MDLSKNKRKQRKQTCMQKKHAKKQKEKVKNERENLKTNMTPEQQIQNSFLNRTVSGEKRIFTQTDPECQTLTKIYAREHATQSRNLDSDCNSVSLLSVRPGVRQI